MKIVIVIILGLLIPVLCFADTIPADTKNQSDTIPLLDESFFSANQTLLLPLSGIAMASGLELMVIGITVITGNAEAGYGAAGMNNGIFIVITGLITSAISAMFVYGTLDSMEFKSAL